MIWFVWFIRTSARPRVAGTSTKGEAEWVHIFIYTPSLVTLTGWAGLRAKQNRRQPVWFTSFKFSARPTEFEIGGWRTVEGGENVYILSTRLYRAGGGHAVEKAYLKLRRPRTKNKRRLPDRLTPVCFARKPA